MAELRFKLDGTTITTQPEGKEDFTEQIQLDFKVFGYLLSYEIPLTFKGDGYDFLYKRYLANGFCDTVQLTIERKCTPAENFIEVFDGTVFIADIQFNLNKCTAEVDVQDNNFSARIKNNKKIKARVNTPLSKNGLTITPVTKIDLQVFIMLTGVYSVNLREAYDLRDCFEYIIAFITDGTVGFQSDYLDNLPDTEGMALVIGSELRTHDGNSLAPEISFEMINEAVHKLENTFFTVQFDANNQPIIRLENDDFFRDNTGALRIENIEDLLQSFDTSRLFANITLGSNNFKKDTSGTFPLPYVPFLTHIEETYQIGGVCNTDRDLDLVSEFSYCTNRIQSLFVNDNDDFDDDIFIIQYTKSTNQATQGFYLTEPTVLPALYNERLLNSSVSERHKIHGELAKFFGTDPEGDKFRASTTSDRTLHIDNTDPAVIFDDSLTQYDDDTTAPNFDTNGNFNVVTFRYVAPAVGFYAFESLFHWRILVNNPGSLFNTVPIPPEHEQFKEARVLHRFTRHNSVGAIIGDDEVTLDFRKFITPAGRLPFVENVLKSYHLQAGDFVDMTIKIETTATATGTGILPEIQLQQVAGSSIFVNFIANGGGIFAPGDADRVPVALFEFDRAVNDATWAIIKGDVSKSITINNDGKTDRVTFPGKVSRNLFTGKTEWQQRADLDQNNI